jgi:probable rRNA maturation factor
MLTNDMSAAEIDVSAGHARATPRRKARLAVTVQYGVSRAGLPARASLERWARAALRRTADVTVRFVGGAEGRALNRRYRGRDYATNVLTFAYSAAGRALEGDIVLCAPVAAREARDQGKPVVAHFAHLVVHGLLHLQKYDHDGDQDAQRMEAAEKRILGKLGFADPYGREG